MILVFGLYALLAMTFTMGKMLLAFVPPFFLIGIRMILAGSCIMLAQLAYYKTWAIKKRDIGLFAFISLVHIFIPYVSEFVALQTVAPSCAALVFNLTPCFTALFSYLIFKEYMTLKKWVGFSISILGVWYLTDPIERVSCGFEVHWSYLLLGLAVMSGALGWTLVRVLLRRGYSVLHINGFAMLVSGVASLICSYIWEPYAQLPLEELDQFLLLLITVIVLSNVIFYNAYAYLLRFYTATLLSFVGFLTPLCTSIYDWYLLDIHVSAEFYVAIVIVAYGIYIFYQEELRQGYVRSEAK